MASRWLALRGNRYKKILLLGCVTAACSCCFILERFWGQHNLSASPPDCETLFAEPLAKIKEALARQNFRSGSSLVDHVMGLANRHTIHLTDAWHDRNWDNEDLVLSRLYQAMMGDESSRPHSSCGPRCMIMAWILQSYGIPSRQVAIFSSKYPDIVGHQQIEVLNPDSGNWELYDPTWNVHFMDEQDGRRASALDMYFGSAGIDERGETVIEGIIPSNQDGSARGWDDRYPFSGDLKAQIANFVKYGAVMYYCYQTQRAYEILVNVHRFDIDKTWDYPNLGLARATFDAYCRKVYPHHSMHFLDGPPSAGLRERIQHPDMLPTY